MASQPKSGAGPDTIIPERAPVIGVAVRYFLVGLGFLAVLLIVAAWKGPMLTQDYLHNPATLAVTHLFTLGFGATVVTGAIYQITPVLLYSNLQSERMANLHLGLHGLGAAMMVVGFLNLQSLWVATGGTLVVIGALLFGWNMAVTFRKVERWNWHGYFMVTAMVYYLSTIFWGLVMAFNQHYGFMNVAGAPLLAHLDMGLIGWFSLMIVGVALKLVPMFAPAKPLPVRLVSATGGALAVGVALTLVGLFFGRILLWAGVLLMVGAAVAYTSGIAYAFRHRRPGSLDFSVRFAITSASALLLILLAAFAGAAFAPDGLSHRAETALTFAFALAWIGGTILGLLLRIIPFMTWLHRFRNRTHKLEKIPFLHEMFHRGFGWGVYAAWYPAVLLMALGIWLEAPALIAAGAVVGLGALASMGWAIGQVLWHIKPGRPALYAGRKP